MTNPQYDFNYNDIMYLGSSIYNKVNLEREAIQKLLNYAKEVLDDDIFLLKLDIKKSTDENKEINIDTLNLLDYIDKNELNDESTEKLIKEIESKNLNKKFNPDALKRFVRTVKFVYATNKLLNNVRPILEKTFKEIGINIEDPTVQTYLNNIEKGVKNVNELTEIIKNNNVILTDEQNLVVLNFLTLVLENFVDTPIN